jgi:hypothetical protein
MYNRKRLSIPDVKHLFPKIDPVKAFLGRQIQDIPKMADKLLTTLSRMFKCT